MNLQTLTSARLRLEPLALHHAEQLFGLSQDPDLYRLIPREPPQSIEKFRESIRFLEGRISKDETEYWFNWISIEDATNRIVGRIEITLNRSSMQAFLAYTTFKPYWQKGFAQEACKEVVKHVLSVWNACSVTIEMDARNQASVKLAESIGAKRVGFKERAEFLKGEWSDEYRYEILP